jgi:hypothetical protein
VSDHHHMDERSEENHVASLSPVEPSARAAISWRPGQKRRCQESLRPAAPSGAGGRPERARSHGSACATGRSPAAKPRRRFAWPSGRTGRSPVPRSAQRTPRASATCRSVAAGQQPAMRVAGHRLARRLQRCRLSRRQLVHLGPLEHEHGAEERLSLARLLAGPEVALLDRHRRQDPDRLLAFPESLAELEPPLEARAERHPEPTREHLAQRCGGLATIAG